MSEKKLTWKNIAPGMTDENEAIVELDNEEFWGVSELKVKHTLSMQEMGAFVGSVVSMCIDEENAEYSPEMFNFATRLSVMHYYAGIPFPSGKDGTVQRMSSKAYFILYDTDLYENVLKHINLVQFDTMTSAIRTRIQFYRDLFVSAAVQKVTGLLEKMDEQMNEGMDALRQIDLDGLEQVAKQVSEKGFAISDPKEEKRVSISDKNVVFLKPDGGLDL